MGLLGEIKISVREYARQLSVDEKAVRKAISDGKIKKGYDKKTKKITASIANKEWGFLHEVPTPRRGVSQKKVIEKLDKKSPSKPAPSAPTEDVVLESFSYSELIDKIKISAELSYQEAIRRKEILAIAKGKMELEELQGLLVRKTLVDRALFSIGVEFKKALMNIPARAIHDIRAATNDTEAMNILTSELQIALNHIPAEVRIKK